MPQVFFLSLLDNPPSPRTGSMFSRDLNDTLENLKAWAKSGVELWLVSDLFILTKPLSHPEAQWEKLTAFH